MAPVLGYWNIRGLAQPIRLLLNYVGAEFEDKQYSRGPAPDFISEDWRNDKFTMGLPFPNLPYWIDGDIKITQSHAIMRYLAKKHDLGPKSDEEVVRCDLMDYQLDDFLWSQIFVCYTDIYKWGKYEEKRTEYLAKLPDKLKLFSEFLDSHPWFAGENLTYVDFWAYEAFEGHRQFAPGCLDTFDNLGEFMARFESLPAIQKYVQSDKFIKKPFWSEYANWTG